MYNHGRVIAGLSPVSKSMGVPGRVVLCAALVLLCLPLVVAADAQDPKVVVLLYAAAPLRPVPLALDEAIRTTLATGVPAPIQFYTEFLDLSRSSGEQHEQRLASVLRQKYADLKIDLIISISTPALQFLLRHRAQLFPGLPVVFCGVNADAVAGLELEPDIRGVRMHPEWDATLSAALSLHPDTSRVAVVSGTSQIDRAWGAAAARALAKYAQQVEFVFLGDQPMERLLDEVAGLPKGTIVFYVSLFRDAAGRPFDSAEALSVLARAANAPVYGWSEAYLGHGIVGGRLIDFEVQGVRAGELGLRILRGETPKSLPILDEVATGYMFDGRELRRWGIRESRLPFGSIVRYEEASLWTRYRWRVIGGGMLTIAGAFLITGLLLQRTGRRRAELSLAERLRFESLLSELSARLIHVPLKEWDTEIERALQQVVEFLRIDRATLNDFVPGEPPLCISWAAAGIEPPLRISEPDQFPWTASQLERGQVVRFSRLDELPVEAVVDRRGYQSRGTRSYLSLPLSAGGPVLGVLSFDVVRGERIWPEELVQRLQLLSEVFASALERKRADLALAERLRFEALLAEQSLAFSSLSAADVDREIERGLRQIVDFLKVDRGSLAEFSADSRTAHITHSWAAEGVEPLPSAIRLGQFPWVTARVQRGEVVRFSQSDELPEQEAAVDRRTYLSLGITSHVEVPLMVEGTVVGALAFSTLGAERPWRDELVQRLRLLGEVFANILSRRRSELEAQRLRRDLAHVGRVSTLGELTASLAHELNQPLTAILSNAQAAQRILEARTGNLEEMSAILKDIVEDDKRAAAVIHRLRGLLKKGDLELSSLDLNELVGEVARLVSSDMIVRDVVLRLELTPGLPPVWGDRVQLQQVVLNLILNGLDALQESRTGDRALVLRTDRDGPAAVRVAVRDSGIGIDETDLDHIFHAFYTTKPDGLGMGLAIARSIVEAHGGRLEAQNNADGGASFSFTLPLSDKEQ
jgi:signal transduction histidine kinase/ABC-type uncharacterized transport system substrate-binding protein